MLHINGTCPYYYSDMMLGSRIAHTTRRLLDIFFKIESNLKFVNHYVN